MRSLFIAIFVSAITLFSVNSFAHDLDGDGKIGLAEAIEALQIVAGMSFEDTQQLCNDGIDNDEDGHIDCADDECSGMTCDDGNVCTSDDICSAGVCQGGTSISCHDGNQCTDDSCDPALGCVYTDINGGACNDGLTCTSNDTCIQGSCVGDLSGCPTLDCEDAICNAVGGCDVQLKSGWCRIEGACYSDGSPHPTNECQLCDAQSNPEAWSNETGACDDGISCTHSDICASGVCTGTSYTCSDGLACTYDVCDGYGSCSFPIVSNDCNISGTCYSDGSPNPTNECQVCDAQISQETWSNRIGACDDGNLCTENDTCSAGTCQGTPKDCSPYADQCNDGSCDSSTGDCVITPLTGQSCDDNEACTLSDNCSDEGVCQGTWDVINCGPAQ